jgi:hypothetical protein
MGKLFKQFHYNINDPHNTAVMPADMKLACQLAVPRHKANTVLGESLLMIPVKERIKRTSKI